VACQWTCQCMQPASEEGEGGPACGAGVALASEPARARGAHGTAAAMPPRPALALPAGGRRRRSLPRPGRIRLQLVTLPVAPGAGAWIMIPNGPELPARLKLATLAMVPTLTRTLICHVLGLATSICYAAALIVSESSN
jgi:hypothetical protein